MLAIGAGSIFLACILYGLLRKISRLQSRSDQECKREIEDLRAQLKTANSAKSLLELKLMTSQTEARHVRLLLQELGFNPSRHGLSYRHSEGQAYELIARSEDGKPCPPYWKRTAWKWTPVISIAALGFPPTHKTARVGGFIV